MPLVPSYLESLVPYEAGRSIDEVRTRYGLSHVIKLASNENPVGASPLALEALRASCSSVHLYPSGGLLLRKALAEQQNVDVDNVIAGAGSDSIISNIVRTFLCDEDEILTTAGAFLGFQVIAKSRGVPFKTVPYSEWRYDLRAIARAVTAHTKIIYLANPNNPTGTVFTAAEFEAFYREIPERVLIILDEAYFEYAAGSPGYPDSMRYRFDNVITLRTFSKAYGLAGLRVGYGFAHENLIRNLLKVKVPFEPSGPGEIAALAALRDHEFLEGSVRANAKGLDYLTSAVSHRGIEIVPSKANFVMAVFPSPQLAAAFVLGLVEHGVIVRPLASFGLPCCVRISIGTGNENDFFINTLDALLGSGLDFGVTRVCHGK